ncbi:hypothetical protein TNCV_1563291 [Trichonephila clavipes]|nr:hypothetical protein TNCV_1563291 [Trichonephila clavipes]
MMKRVSYTADLKLNTVEKSESRSCKIFQRLRIEYSFVEKEQNFENCDRRKRADRRGKPHWPELEAEINKWILKERDDGKAVSTVSIRMKARVIAREMVVQRSDRNYLMTRKTIGRLFDILQANYC